MTNATVTGWQCPKDGVVMEPFGRRSAARRCPNCRGVFIDTEALRQGRQAAKWSPVLTSVLVSLLATFVARRLRRHAPKRSAS